MFPNRAAPFYYAYADVYRMLGADLGLCDAGAYVLHESVGLRDGPFSVVEIGKVDTARNRHSHRDQGMEQVLKLFDTVLPLDK